MMKRLEELSAKVKSDLGHLWSLPDGDSDSAMKCHNIV